MPPLIRLLPRFRCFSSSLLLSLYFLLQMAYFLNFFSSTSNQWPIRRHGQFCVLFNFTSAANPAGPITLAVHSSLHFVHKLHAQAQHWDGPISAAVLLRPDEQMALVNLLALWQCSPQMRQKVSLHLVWRMGPFQQQQGEEEEEEGPHIDGCGCFLPPIPPSATFQCPTTNGSDISPKTVLLPIAGSLDWSPLRYPINTLRNLARLGAGPASPFHVVADVENLFSANFTTIVAEYAQKMDAKKREGEGGRRRRELLVFRRFEMEEGEEAPTSLEQLNEQIRRGKAFPFHRHYFPIAHRIPGLPRWLNYSLSNGTIRSSPLSFMNAAFEPQFLMPADAPLHFEAVPARLYDHQVLHYFHLIELCRSGFRLRLLSHVFNVHPGVRRDLSDAEKLVKWIAAKQEWALRRDFRQYLDQKYGDDQNCPNFWDRLNVARVGASNFTSIE